jgi:hypothetical protein
VEVVTENGKGGMSNLDRLLMSLAIPPILDSTQLPVIVLAKELKQFKKKLFNKTVLFFVFLSLL